MNPTPKKISTESTAPAAENFVARHLRGASEGNPSSHEAVATDAFATLATIVSGQGIHHRRSKPNPRVEKASRLAAEKRNATKKLREWRSLRRLVRLADSQEAEQSMAGVGLLMIRTNEALKNAKTLWEMAHSDDEGLSSIQAFLDANPVDALTLMSLVRIEREEGERKVVPAVRTQLGLAGSAGKAAAYASRREWVRAEWLRCGESDFAGNKSAFARKYVGVVKTRFGTGVAATTIKDKYIADL